MAVIPKEAEVDLAEGVVETPPPMRRRPFHFDAAIDNPGEWVVLRRYNTQSAQRVAHSLRRNPPAGRWEFRGATNHPKQGLSTVYGRYLGPE